MSIITDQEYFAGSMDLPSRDFMKKCDTYLRGKGRSMVSSANPVINHVRLPPNSPYPERPPMGGPSASERTIRPPPSSTPHHPGMPHLNASYPPPGSPALPSHIIAQTAVQEDWRPPPPRHSPESESASPSRPTSFIQNQRLSIDQPNTYAPNQNGYPAAVRQRT